MKQEERLEHIRKIELGDKARAFLQSSEWKELVKPIIDSMLKGLVDIRDIKKSLLTSNKKAEILVEGRATAAEYLSEIESYINGFSIEGDNSKQILEKQTKASDLYQEVK